jgi:uncharacterized membrane protein
MHHERKKLIKSGTEQLNEIQEIIQKSIAEEKNLVENLLSESEEELTTGQKISDQVAKFGGSWMFIISFSVVLFIWILFNSFASTRTQFDPFPFILMNLILSTIAALQAPIIMMSQNRTEERDRKRNENDYLINLKAELQIRSLHHKIDVLQKDQMKILYETQARQLELLENIVNKLTEVKS